MTLIISPFFLDFRSSKSFFPKSLFPAHEKIYEEEDLVIYLIIWGKKSACQKWLIDLYFQCVWGIL